MPADAMGPSDGNRLDQCPLGLEEQDPCPRGKEESLEGIKGPKAELLAPGGRLCEGPDRQQPLHVGPWEGLIQWLKASEKPTFRTWEDTYLPAHPTVRAAAPPAFLVQLLLACPRGWEAQHLSWQPRPGEAVQTGRNSPWGCCLPWAIPGLGPAGTLEPSVSGGVWHLATLHLLPRSTRLPNEAHSAAETPCSLVQARPGRPSHGILSFPQPAPPSVEGSGP